jgi:hypothetical protein
LTILDVVCGSGIDKRVGEALFTHLKSMGHPVLAKLLNVVSDNGSDAISAVATLFCLVNTLVGYNQMLSSNHVRCACRSVQIGVIQVLKLVRDIMAHLRMAVVVIRRSKVVRHAYRGEAEVAILVSKEPTHQDSPTRWNSTHDMGNHAILKRVPFDVTLGRYEGVIGVGQLSDAQRGYIEGVTGFLRLPRQVMASLLAERKSTLDLVSLTLPHLLNHCNDGDAGLQEIDLNLTATKMKSELERYKSLFIQETAIVAAYLNPQLPKPTDPIEQFKLMLTICAVLQRRHSVEIVEVC